MKNDRSVRRVTPFAITVLVLCAGIGFALWLSYLPWRWERTKEDLRKKYPSVRRIEADDLKSWFAKAGGDKPVLIDVRPKTEFEFSHLPGAKNMALSETPASLGIPETTNESLVIYDAVGKDAYGVAANLSRRRYARVQVLDGGIFEWANRGGKLEGASGITGRVLVGKSEFAGLLKRHARADK